MNPMWFEIMGNPDEISAKLNEFIDLNEDTTTKGVMWDALKAYLRGIFIQQVAKIKKSSREWENKRIRSGRS